MTDRDLPHHFNPDRPHQLPLELAAFLREQQYAGLLHATDLGTAFIIKAPGDEIDGLRGPLPVLFRHELYRHPSSPVIRLLLRLYDRPDGRSSSSLAFESFVNVDDDGQRNDYGELARQDEVALHFYDEALRHRLTKRIANTLRPDIPLVLLTALRLRARIPHERFDFDRAKADVIARTSL